MKQYIKDGEIYNAPLKIKDGEKTIVTNNDSVAKKYGYELYFPAVDNPSLEQMIAESVERINKECDEKILNEFFWNGNEYYLSLENQFNFKNLYDLRNQRQYPVTVKTKNGFMELKTPEEVEAFYLSGVMFIEECLQDGWKQKAEAEAKIRSDYKWSSQS